ncbi:MAG: hypothetical protein CL840_09595 [Crocinitomicaceae bacterium]|nr:hypothetical protein [Crocinitomicaceae bacterium]|tara:strand:+ start:2607 stop:3431 length:825 start_codon:yes stop_codon:yes gene_type:complete
MSKSKTPLHFILFIVVLALLTGCKTKKKIQKVDVQALMGKEKFESLEDSLYANKSNPESISIKSKVYFKTPKLSDSFKMHIRMKKDSIIWISATYYKVEVARLLLLPDSVKMIDRKNGKYYLGDYRYIENRFKVPLNFDLIQSILLGNPFRLDSAVKVRAYTSRGNIIIASLNNIWFDDGSGERQLKQQKTQMWIDPSTYRVKKSKIAEYKTKKHFTTMYSDTIMVNGHAIPNGAEYILRDDEETKFTSEYLKVESKPDMRFPFTISSKYEPIF